MAAAGIVVKLFPEMVWTDFFFFFLIVLGVPLVINSESQSLAKIPSKLLKSVLYMAVVTFDSKINDSKIPHKNDPSLYSRSTDGVKQRYRRLIVSSRLASSAK